MAKNVHESSHARTVAAFYNLMAACEGFGATYDPSWAPLQLTSLRLLHQQALNSLASVKVDETAFNSATNKRAQVYSPLKPLATRLVNALAACGAADATLADARGYVRKIQGQRAKRIKKPGEENKDAQIDNTISVSQLSFDNQSSHLQSLTELLKQEANYQPKEADLQPLGLKELITNMQQANRDVTDAYTKWAGTRIQRDTIFYNPLTGLVSTALDVKKYVKSVFGASSPQYKQVSGIEFKGR